MLVPARSRIGWIFSSMKAALLLIHMRTWVRYHSGWKEGRKEKKKRRRTLSHKTCPLLLSSFSQTNLAEGTCPPVPTEVVLKPLGERDRHDLDGKTERRRRRRRRAGGLGGRRGGRQEVVPVGGLKTYSPARVEERCERARSGKDTWPGAPEAAPRAAPAARSAPGGSPRAPATERSGRRLATGAALKSFQSRYRSMEEGGRGGV